MRAGYQRSLDRSVRLLSATLLALALTIAPISTIAQSPPPSPAAPLPQDTGIAGLRQMIRKLHTTARLLHTTAHPDDEDGAMLTLESRGRGAEVMLLTLNRGEGGQNKLGSNLFDVLGVVRTLELLAADRYYGVEQRFTRAADFGYSKTADETFAKWGGHDPVLSDMVRVIRTFRPDVIVSRFQGTPKDGHGHHQAAGILTREAFHAAADPQRFPEQIKEGLRPWQAKKLYVDNARPPEEHTLVIDTAGQDPLLGMNYAQFAMQGARHHLSQGAGEWNVNPGPRYYKLVDSVLPNVKPGMQEKDFFEGIDTGLPGLAAGLGDEEKKVPWLRPALVEIERKVTQAEQHPAAAAGTLLDGYQDVKRVLARLAEAPELSPGALAELRTALTTKLEQFQHAANLALGVEVEAIAGGAPAIREGLMGIRGETFRLSVSVRGPMVGVIGIHLDLPHGWKSVQVGPISATKNGFKASFQVTVADDAPYTRPCVHRASELDPVYQLENDQCAVLPLPAPVARVMVEYDYQGHAGAIQAPVEVEFVQAANLLSKRPLADAPKFSVAIDPVRRTVRTGQDAWFDFSLLVRTNLPETSETLNPTFAVLPPAAGWELELLSGPRCMQFNKVGDESNCSYRLTVPAAAREGTYEAAGSVVYDSPYMEGYTLITRPDLGSALYYQPATLRISALDVKLPNNLKVGYIMGAGDDIASVLLQLGLQVSNISPTELASGDLSRFGAIIVGIRAYDTREDVRKYNQRLLDYVSAGGTLIVQYNSNFPQFNSGHYTPYPAEISRERVTVEEAPVSILAPGDRIFHYPNEITARDFEGWVQERGLYFMDKWDPHFEPLLASQDPGEPPLGGGLLRARYGKGIYIYTGYAFFRQLPAGVPGAVRFFVNLVSAGQERNVSKVSNVSEVSTRSH